MPPEEHRQIQPVAEGCRLKAVGENRQVLKDEPVSTWLLS